MTGNDLQSWVGRSETVEETVGLWRAAAMAATLDRLAPAVGSPLPTPWHWLYCVSAAPQAKLAEDGHPLRGDFIPPVLQNQRMWAGSRLEFSGEVRVGDELLRESRVAEVRETRGSSGELVFVGLEHRYSTGRGLALLERQDLVYRHRPQNSQATRPPVVIDVAIEEQLNLRPDERLLFRYSALTFNAHRIHYDLAYAREVEGYPGLLVHGPLLATVLMDLWSHAGRRPVLRSMAIRALAPAFAGNPVELCVGVAAAGQQTLWAQQEGGNPLLRIDLDF